MSSANITFDQIPNSRRTPGVYGEFNAKLASSSLPANRQRVCLLGVRTTTTAPLYTRTDLFSVDDAAQLFGAGSQIHVMAAAALAANPYIALSAVAMPASFTGVQAQGSLALAGTATASGVATLKVGAKKVQAAVAVGDVAQAVLDALAAAASQMTALPVTTAASTGVLGVTAKTKGEAGNDIGLSFTSVAGLTATVAPMSGGAGAPDLTPALDAIFAGGDNILATPYRDATSLTSLRQHLAACGGGLEMRGAVMPVGMTGAYGTAVSTAASINSERVVPAWLRGTASLPWEVTAAIAGVLAFEEDPARPLNTLALPGIEPPAVSQRATGNEVEACLYNGVTPLVVGPGEVVQIKRCVTSYTTNSSGIEDWAWLDVTSIRTMDYTRKAVRERLALRFPRDKLVPRTMRQVRSEVLDVLIRLESLEILVNVRANKDRILVEPDEQTGRLNLRIPTNVVPGLHVIAAVFDLIL